MACNCGVCMECDFARTHADELDQPLSDKDHLMYLSDAVDDLFSTLDNNFDAIIKHNAIESLRLTYKIHGYNTLYNQD